ncbi:MAG: sulfatase-like hydrolase/transferase [Armatimonadota bacterium]|nr:sulfatase-like hydrolase/transferase [Armatimonadota bacterium]
MRFSDQFELGKGQSELDFVDIPLDTDIPLFVDPYALSVETDPWFVECSNLVVDFFQTVIDKIRADDSASARGLLARLHEPNETHLGLSRGRPSGRGVGWLPGRRVARTFGATLAQPCYNVSAYPMEGPRVACESPARREFIKSTIAATGALALGGTGVLAENRQEKRPNILFVMTDQQRFDTIAALGNQHIYTPNLDRLVKRGVTFTQAYSNCPVCVAARYTIRTGCEPPTTGVFSNGAANVVAGQAEAMEDRCGKYLARTMAEMGYRTFGVGKFHSHPWNEDLGFQVQLHCEEQYGSADQRKGDAYASFIDKKHPEHSWIEGLMGERTEMYYVPQWSMMPARLTVESWEADRAIEQIGKPGGKPYFGFVSFLGPHPPCAPPIPFNRMYNPDKLPNPIRGDMAIDHMDEMIPWMNHAIWADDISESWARMIKARYYGEISYIDWCLGRILDAVDAGPYADNTLVCFFADHGDHLGDHQAWQKESFFEASCHIPFLVSWPGRLPANVRRDELVALSDLFGIATTAADKPELRQGVDVIGSVEGRAAKRERLFGHYGVPGTARFKIMVREGDWKYIFIANGGREQLFNVTEDPHELKQRIADRPDVASRLREAAVEALSVPNADRALENGALRAFPCAPGPRQRIYQFDASKGARGFPDRPGEVVQGGTQMNADKHG